MTSDYLPPLRGLGLTTSSPTQEPNMASMAFPNNHQNHFHQQPHQPSSHHPSSHHPSSHQPMAPSPTHANPPSYHSSHGSHASHTSSANGYPSHAPSFTSPVYSTHQSHQPSGPPHNPAHLGMEHPHAVQSVQSVNQPGHQHAHHMQPAPHPHSQHAHHHQSTPLSNVATAARGYRYHLEVCQQPIRARMCGFGDKDRRPVTPPPCVRLHIIDSKTGKEARIDDFRIDHFVLQVDLWSPDGATDVNIVRSSANSPASSISAAVTTSFPPPPERVIAFLPTAQFGPMMNQAVVGVTAPGNMASILYTPPAYDPYSQAAHSPSHALPPHMDLSGHAAAQQAPVAYAMQTTHASGSTHTRNLIGSLHVNGLKLKDHKNEEGIWFVLQDLSVRTEGTFRLRFSFMDILDHETGERSMKTIPILASCFSDIFQVYSAKKFPGVIESTPLSKAFASQGVKIPIRKDNKALANAEEYENDNDDPAAA